MPFVRYTLSEGNEDDEGVYRVWEIITTFQLSLQTQAFGEALSRNTGSVPAQFCSELPHHQVHLVTGKINMSVSVCRVRS